MKLKRALVFLLCCVLILTLTACTKGSGMYVEPAKLTVAEEEIVKLLGVNQESRLFDYCVDKTVKSMQVNAYELTDGAWSFVAGGGGQEITDRKGRIALGYQRIAEGLRIATLNNHQHSGTSYEREAETNTGEMAVVSAILSDREEITYEQEIPLVVQAMLPGSTYIPFSLDSFYHPEEFAGQGEGVRVFAITVRFSQKTAEELIASFDEQP